MSNTNNTMQTQTSNTLHNAIMEAGGKDRPPMLALDKVVPVTKGSSETTTKRIDNDIYSIVDACPNACEMWKAIERLKQGESINVQDLETNLYWEFRKFTSRDGESLESYYSRFYNMMNELFRNQYDEMSKDKEIDKLMALISLSFKKIYKPTNNNLQTSSNTSRANQDNSPRINRGTGIQFYNCKEFGHVARECQKPKWAKDVAYHKEKMLLCKQEEAGFQLNAKQADWRDDTDDESEDHELEVSNNDNYNVFAIKSEHPEQFKYVNDKYLIEQDEHNVIIDSLDISYDREQIDQVDDDDHLANERDLLASLIERLKYEIDDIKNRNKFLETSNKVLVDKLKVQIKQGMQAAHDRQKSYADLKRKQMEFQVGDKVMLKVSPWKKGRTLWQTGEVKP
nr:reverse transcriptase domain-containing protein [Tanacetum cinerariifolium]